MWWAPCRCESASVAWGACVSIGHRLRIRPSWASHRFFSFFFLSPLWHCVRFLHNRFHKLSTHTHLGTHRRDPSSLSRRFHPEFDAVSDWLSSLLRMPQSKAGDREFDLAKLRHFRARINHPRPATSNTGVSSPLPPSLILSLQEWRRGGYWRLIRCSLSPRRPCPSVLVGRRLSPLGGASPSLRHAAAFTGGTCSLPPTPALQSRYPLWLNPPPSHPLMRTRRLPPPLPCGMTGGAPAPPIGRLLPPLACPVPPPRRVSARPSPMLSSAQLSMATRPTRGLMTFCGRSLVTADCRALGAGGTRRQSPTR